MPPNLPKAILFDNDGVLIASEPLHWAAWQRLLPELGLPYPRELIEGAVGLTSPQILARILDQYRPGWDSLQWDLEALAQRKNDFYLEFALKGLQPYPGVREGLAWLRSRGIRTAVVTNAKRNELTKALGGIGLLDFFDALVSRDDARAFKPDPRPYALGCEWLEVLPSEAFAIEDSPTGMESALLAGVPTIGVMNNFPREALESPVPGRSDLRALRVVQTMEEFFSWLASL